MPKERTKFRMSGETTYSQIGFINLPSTLNNGTTLLNLFRRIHSKSNRVRIFRGFSVLVFLTLPWGIGCIFAVTDVLSLKVLLCVLLVTLR